jgi:hypothetical protein
VIFLVFSFAAVQFDELAEYTRYMNRRTLIIQASMRPEFPAHSLSYISKPVIIITNKKFVRFKKRKKNRKQKIGSLEKT